MRFREDRPIIGAIPVKTSEKSCKIFWFVLSRFRNIIPILLSFIWEKQIAFDIQGVFPLTWFFLFHNIRYKIRMVLKLLLRLSSVRIDDIDYGIERSSPQTIVPNKWKTTQPTFCIPEVKCDKILEFVSQEYRYDRVYLTFIVS